MHIATVPQQKLKLSPHKLDKTRVKNTTVAGRHEFHSPRNSTYVSLSRQRLRASSAHLSNFPRVANSIDANAHLFHIIKAIENPEDIDPILCSESDELCHHVVRIGRIPDGIGASDEHLRGHKRSTRPTSELSAAGLT